MSIDEAARLIREGELVAFPTETVYGLGGDATNERAVAKIFEAKGRPQFNPLISHVLDAGEARRLVQWSDVADKLAARFWPGESALGKRIKQGWPEDPGTWREVVGVVADVKLEGVDQHTPLQIYLPLPQAPSRNVSVVIRTATEPEGLTAALESAIQGVQPDLPVARILPMTRLMTRAIATRRLSTMIFAVFAGVAMLIAAVGLYGVVSQSVTERTREIGLRMALGAERRRVLGMFVRQGLLTALVGVAAGTVGAVLLSKWVEQLVFNVAPRDPATLGAVAGLLLGVAALACYVPARRAARVDPLIALKAE